MAAQPILTCSRYRITDVERADMAQQAGSFYQTATFVAPSWTHIFSPVCGHGGNPTDVGCLSRKQTDLLNYKEVELNSRRYKLDREGTRVAVAIVKFQLVTSWGHCCVRYPVWLSSIEVVFKPNPVVIRVSPIGSV